MWNWFGAEMHLIWNWLGTDLEELILELTWRWCGNCFQITSKSPPINSDQSHMISDLFNSYLMVGKWFGNDLEVIREWCGSEFWNLFGTNLQIISKWYGNDSGMTWKGSFVELISKKIWIWFAIDWYLTWNWFGRDFWNWCGRADFGFDLGQFRNWCAIHWWTDFRSVSGMMWKWFATDVVEVNCIWFGTDLEVISKWSGNDSGMAWTWSWSWLTFDLELTWNWLVTDLELIWKIWNVCGYQFHITSRIKCNSCGSGLELIRTCFGRRADLELFCNWLGIDLYLLWNLALIRARVQRLGSERR